MTDKPCTADHRNPANWGEKPDPNRRGWTASYCKVCGRLIGYRMNDDRRNTKREKYD